MASESEREQYPKTRHFLAGRLRHDMSEAEKAELENLAGNIQTFEDGHRLISRGDECEYSTMLVEGFMLRTPECEDRRYGVSFHVPGDFVDLHCFALKRLDHNIDCVGPTTVAQIPHDGIARIMQEKPHLARLFWFSTLLDAAMHREWIFRLGRLNAEGRIAHLISEIIERHKFVGLYDGRTLPVSLLQRDYAEACGITSVHANRSFRVLKERGVLELRGEGRIEILDEAELKRLGEFEGAAVYPRSWVC